MPTAVRDVVCGAAPVLNTGSRVNILSQEGYRYSCTVGYRYGFFFALFLFNFEKRLRVCRCFDTELGVSPARADQVSPMVVSCRVVSCLDCDGCLCLLLVRVPVMEERGAVDAINAMMLLVLLQKGSRRGCTGVRLSMLSLLCCFVAGVVTRHVWRLVTDVIRRCGGQSLLGHLK